MSIKDTVADINAILHGGEYDSINEDKIDIYLGVDNRTAVGTPLLFLPQNWHLQSFFFQDIVIVCYSMPAKNRNIIDEAGIYYHIYNKGVEKRIIFNDEEDSKVFLGYLEDYLTAPKDPESVKKVFKIRGRTFRGTPHQPKNYLSKVELIAYSLMPDHFHLLLHQKTRGSLESFIRSLCTRYSIYFNKKYQRTGALFEGPYKSVQIEDEPRLLQLTRYLHHTGSYSSYAEYLGARVTSWVKTKVVQSFFDKAKADLFKGTHSYKDFVEKFELAQKEKEFLESVTFHNDTQCLERIDLTSSGEIHSDPYTKPPSRVPEILIVSTVMFLVLITLGIRNINLTVSTGPQHLPAPEVLSETEEVKPEAKPKVILTVKLSDASSSANIRQKPTANSEKIGEAKYGDTFEFVSFDSGWYGVKLADGSTGFISATYIKKGETNN